MHNHNNQTIFPKPRFFLIAMKEKVTNSRGLHYDPLSLNKDRNSSTSKIVQQNSSIAERKQERNYGDEEDEEDVDEDEDVTFQYFI